MKYIKKILNFKIKYFEEKNKLFKKNIEKLLNEAIELKVF